MLDLYCISVIGFIQSIITPELRNEFENGIGSNQINNLKASIFYRSARDATEGLGFDNLLGIKHGKRFPPLPRIECDVNTIELLEDHIKNKQSKLIDQGKKLYENKVTIQLGNNVRS